MLRCRSVLLSAATLLFCAANFTSAKSNSASNCTVRIGFDLVATPAVLALGDFVESIDACPCYGTLAAVCAPPLNASDFTNVSTFWDGNAGTFHALIGGPSSEDAQHVADLLTAAFQNASLGDVLRLNCFAVTTSFRADIIGVPVSPDPPPLPAVDTCSPISCTGHCVATSPSVSTSVAFLAWPILAFVSMLSSLASVGSMYALPILRKNPFHNILAVMMWIQVMMGVYYLTFVALVIGSGGLRALSCSVLIVFFNMSGFVFYATVAWNSVFSAHFIISLRYPDLARWPHLFRAYHIACWLLLVLMGLYANLSSDIVSCDHPRVNGRSDLSPISFAIIILPITVSYLCALVSFRTVVVDSGRIAASLCDRFKIVMRSFSFTNAYLFYTVWIVYFFSLQLGTTPVAFESAGILANIATASYGTVLSVLWFSSTPFLDALRRWRAGYPAEDGEVSQTHSLSQSHPYSPGVSMSAFDTDTNPGNDQYMSLDDAAQY